MAQGPSDTILVAIQITLRIRESKVRNPDPPDRRRFVLSEHSFLVSTILARLLTPVLTNVLSPLTRRKQVGSRLKKVKHVFIHITR